MSARLRIEDRLAQIEAAVVENYSEAIEELQSDYARAKTFKRSGSKRCDRPQLNNALNRCRETGAKLVIAHLDRLALHPFSPARSMTFRTVCACQRPPRAVLTPRA